MTRAIYYPHAKLFASQFMILYFSILVSAEGFTTSTSPNHKLRSSAANTYNKNLNTSSWALLISEPTQQHPYHSGSGANATIQELLFLSKSTGISIKHNGAIGSLGDSDLGHGWHHFSGPVLDSFTQKSLEGIFTSHPNVVHSALQVPRKRVRRSSYTIPNDPQFGKQWYLRNDYHLPPPMRIETLWKAGFTGKGIVISIVDDGVEHSNPDLAGNYDAAASYDYNDNDEDPFPRYEPTNINKHGTRCAGIAAATANNQICGAGVAYNARVGGLRMLDGPVSDVAEGGSLSFKPNYIDIYSSSWGPDDDGQTIEGPGPLAQKALERGIRDGRDSLGSIFVWAAGNGGSGDNCNVDSYANSIYTLSVGGLENPSGKPLIYNEPCAALFTVAYGQRMTTSDLHNSCTDRFAGSSAAAPVVAGIVALLLEANPCLSWRDVQHIVVRSSTSSDLGNSQSGWIKNAGGRSYHLKMGFGLLRADRALEVLKTWITVHSQIYVESQIQSGGHVAKNKPREFSFQTDGCSRKRKSKLCIRWLEHVSVHIKIDSPYRGGHIIELRSPSGTTVQLLSERVRDQSKERLDWNLQTVAFWDEPAAGKWSLIVSNSRGSYLKEWMITLRGTPQISMPGSSNVSSSIWRGFLDDIGKRKWTRRECPICKSSEYSNGEGLCLPCDSSCNGMCFGPGEAGCFPTESPFAKWSKVIVFSTVVIVLLIVVLSIFYASISKSFMLYVKEACTSFRQRWCKCCISDYEPLPNIDLEENIEQNNVEETSESVTSDPFTIGDTCGNTFKDWLYLKKEESTRIGKLGAIAHLDQSFPRSNSLASHVDHLNSKGAGNKFFEVLREAWVEYQAWLSSLEEDLRDENGVYSDMDIDEVGTRNSTTQISLVDNEDPMYEIEIDDDIEYI
eukprot:UC4_evm1s139